MSSRNYSLILIQFGDDVGKILQWYYCDQYDAISILLPGGDMILFNIYPLGPNRSFRSYSQLVNSGIIHETLAYQINVDSNKESRFRLNILNIINESQRDQMVYRMINSLIRDLSDIPEIIEIPKKNNIYMTNHISGPTKQSFQLDKICIDQSNILNKDIYRNLSDIVMKKISSGQMKAQTENNIDISPIKKSLQQLQVNLLNDTPIDIRHLIESYNLVYQEDKIICPLFTSKRVTVLGSYESDPSVHEKDILFPSHGSDLSKSDPSRLISLLKFLEDRKSVV